MEGVVKDFSDVMEALSGPTRVKKKVVAMKRHMVTFIALVLAVSLFGIAEAMQFSNVLIISIDSLRPDAISEEDAPNLSAIMKKGSFTLKGKSIDPAKTLYNHTAMFIGKHPREIGKDDNDWDEEEPRVSAPTIFRAAKEKGYETAFFYSKSKLGYLVTPDINTHRLVGLKSPEAALSFYENAINPSFVFLHVSGLEFIGMKKGWMSAEYRMMLKDIDSRIKPIIDLMEKKGRFVLIVTSDHAGHGLLHGTDHPDDFRLPFIFYSDTMKMPEIQNADYTPTMLKGMVDKIIGK
jgi:predicted AlkP superfamily pyrophosphatase or phosphodiesterase